MIEVKDNLDTWYVIPFSEIRYASYRMNKDGSISNGEVGLVLIDGTEITYQDQGELDKIKLSGGIINE